MLKNASPSGLWLNLASLVRACDSPTYARGLELYRSQKVLALSLEPIQGGWLLQGQVQGSQRRPYAVSIEATLDAHGQLLEWDSDCSCPVGYQCKHGVALLIKAAYQGLQLLGGKA